MQIRSALPSDADQVSDVCVAALDPRDSADRAGLRRVLWDSPEVRGVVVEVDDVVVGAGFGSVGREDGEPAGFLTLLAVHPGHQRRGLGAALLAVVEDSLRERGSPCAWTGGGQPHFWWSGVPADDAGAVDFFRGRGYVVEDESVNMTVPLAEASLDPDPGVASLVHRIEPHEWPAFQSWMETTWDDPWSIEVQRARDRSPTSCFVALRDEEVLGFAAYDTNRTGLFGPMGTSPAARGSGLGAELLRACLRDYVGQGRAHCDIGWVGPIGFYERTVGAVVSDRFVRLRKELPE